MVGGVAASVALAGAAQAELPVNHDLPLAIAIANVQGAVASCGGHGFSVSAIIVDRNGDTIVSARGDGDRGYTMENAPRKAYTAANFRVATSDYAKRFTDNDAVVRQQVTLPSVIASSGGPPIRLGDEVIGAAGESGSTGIDERCAQAGLDRVSDQLH